MNEDSGFHNFWTVAVAVADAVVTTTRFGLGHLLHLPLQLHLSYNRTNTSTIRSAAFPSHNSGTPPFFQAPFIIRVRAGAMAAGSVPISSLVPTVQVSGRSVLSRRVRHGTPMTVVSSVMPPESVMTPRACLTR